MASRSSPKFTHEKAGRTEAVVTVCTAGSSSSSKASKVTRVAKTATSVEKVATAAKLAEAAAAADKAADVAKLGKNYNQKNFVIQSGPDDLIPKVPEPKKGGPYGHFEDGPSVNSGKGFTPAQKKKILAENKAKHGGVGKDDVTGEIGVPSQQSKRGVTPPDNELQVDHVYPKTKGGPNCYSNAEVRLRKYNIQKSDKLPGEE